MFGDQETEENTITHCLRDPHVGRKSSGKHEEWKCLCSMDRNKLEHIVYRLSGREFLSGLIHGLFGRMLRIHSSELGCAPLRVNVGYDG